MNETSIQRTLPAAITGQLTAFRRQVRWVKWAEGLLAAAVGLLISWFAVFVLDRFMETPGWLRATLLLAGMAVPGLLLPLVWHRWVWRQRRLEDVARLVRRSFPRLGDQLLGIIELAHADNNAFAGRSERLVQAAIDQAAEAVQKRDLKPAVPSPRHRAWALAAGATAALALLAAIAVPAASFNAFVRWVAPWMDTDRYTFSRIDPLPDNLVVPFAESFEVPATLTEESRWDPQSARARVERQRPQTVAAEERRFPFRFGPQTEDVGISFRVGDERARVNLKPRTRPEMTSIRARLRLPDYLGYTSEPELDVRGGSVRLLRGADVSWIIEASRELSSAQVDDRPQDVDGTRLVSSWLPVEESRDWGFRWLDELGLEPRQPLSLSVQAVEDEAPLISARREQLQDVVLVNEVVAFDLSAQDDFGIRRVGLEWWGANSRQLTNGNTIHGERIAAAGEPEQREIATRATFSAERDGVEPQIIQVRAWAEDFLPGRDRVYSAPFTLRVLDPTEHALWLTERFGEWMQAARETYEREQQLHQTNLELRELSAEELDTPDARRQLAQQAAEERANAARLDALTDIGRNLIEQGTRNQEFDANQLENWAQLMEQLDDIAANRMPSVADLLRDSSNAAGASSPGDPSGESGAPGEPGESGAAGEASPGDPSGESGAPGEGAAGEADEPGAPGEPGASGEPGESGMPGESGTPGEPGDPGASGETAPSINQGESAPAGEAGAGDPGEAPPVPNISDRESGFLEPPDAQPPGEESGAGGEGALSLPQTTLGALPEDGEPQPPSPPSPAQESLDGALDEQRDLLAEFSKVSEELSELLGSFEASTFVKRLKTASRSQLDLASSLTNDALDSFGLALDSVPEANAQTNASLASEAREHSEFVALIQNDLTAYIQRNPELRFTSLLQEMRDSQVVRELAGIGDITDQNFNGRSIASAELWADTLDRWAENLVAAPEPQEGEGEGGESESVPPEVILKMMQALRAEIDLRDATREVDNARPALEERVFEKQARQLSESQWETAQLVGEAIDLLTHEPQGPERFQNEIGLLTRVAEVMVEARDILAEPDTGSRAIAAETEAIELLLQASRDSSGGGGGGGGGSPGSGDGSQRSSTALARLGQGSQAEGEAPERAVDQATGRAGREFPEEFRSGLDAYFNNLESTRD